MWTDELDLPRGKLTEAVQRVIERATLESRRRGHAALTGDHLFLALAQIEWQVVVDVTREVGRNPHAILAEIEEGVSAFSRGRGAGAAARAEQGPLKDGFDRPDGVLLFLPGKTVSIDAAALDRLVSEGHSPAYGARFLKRVIDERGKLAISARWHEGTHYQVDVQDGQVTVEASSPSLICGEQETRHDCLVA